MRIDTEFDIGDEVWAVFQPPVSDKYEVIGPEKIEHVCVHLHAGNREPDIYYYLSSHCFWAFTFDEIFETREAAEITAEALNK